jgi:hypothetical protein
METGRKKNANTRLIRREILRGIVGFFAVAALTAPGLLFAGCFDDEDDCEPGSEGCDCEKGWKCDPGLTCMSVLCVDPNTAAGVADDGGTGGEATAGASGGGGAAGDKAGKEGTGAGGKSGGGGGGGTGGLGGSGGTQ